MVEMDGFEPPRPFGNQIYSLVQSTALPHLRNYLVRPEGIEPPLDRL